ncbi:MAG: flagellar protein [Lachnospiraceae bacterium]|nr:flagellar protein [Lachnospiraceae bacterium]
MNGISNQFTSIEQVTEQYLGAQGVKNLQKESDIKFDEILRKKQIEGSKQLESLKFSKHAAMRLENRNINLSENQSERLEAGVRKAGEKGIRESLVVLDSLAFIVNIPNKTVVTAIDRNESEDNIFTNIDGAVIV